MKGEVIQDPDDGFIDGQKLVKERADDIQRRTGFLGSTVDEVKPETGEKVLYVSW
jgi:hypothetical protein